MKHNSNRIGISIIEVLISIAVATIGVFGVMIMIPFAVSQSQRGLDSDIASGLGRNAIEKLKIYSVFRGIRVDDDTGMQIDEVLGSIAFPSEHVADQLESVRLADEFVVANYSLTSLGLSDPRDPRYAIGLVHLDPVGVAYAGGPITSFAIDPQLVIPSVTFRSGDTTRVDKDITARFSFAEARNFCATDDDLVFGESRFDPEVGYVDTGDLAPPQGQFDIVDGVPIKRQAEGSISWSVLLNPSKNSSIVKENEADSPTSPGNFDAYLLTWRRRSFSGQAFTSRLANDPGKYGLGTTNRQSQLRELVLTEPIDEGSNIRRGNWVMLINRLPSPDYKAFNEPQLPLSEFFDGTRFRAEEQGYEKQIAFARITGVDTSDSMHRITIGGAAFEIFPKDIARSPTFVVHLPEVVNVYERSVTIER